MGKFKKLFSVRRTPVKRISHNKGKGKNKSDQSAEPNANQSTGATFSDESDDLEPKEPPRKAKKVWFGENILPSVLEESDSDIKSESREIPEEHIPTKTDIERKPSANQSKNVDVEKKHKSKSILRPPKLTEKVVCNGISNVTTRPTDYGCFLTKIVVNLKHLTDIVKESDADDTEEICADTPYGSVNIPNSTEGYIDGIQPGGQTFLTESTNSDKTENGTESQTLKATPDGFDVSPQNPELYNKQPLSDSLVKSNRLSDICKNTKTNYSDVQHPAAEVITVDVKEDTNSESAHRCEYKRKGKLSSLSFKRKEQETSIYVRTPRVVTARVLIGKKETRERNIFSHIGLPGKNSHVYKNNLKLFESINKPEDRDKVPTDIDQEAELLSVRNSSHSVWDPLSSVCDSHPKSYKGQTTGECGTNSHTIGSDEALSLSSASSRSSSCTSSMRSCRSARSHVSSVCNIRPEDVLPQRTFFNCHENTLKQAGYRISELERTVAAAKEKKKPSSNQDPGLGNNLTVEDKFADHHASTTSVASSVVGLTAHLSLKQRKKKPSKKSKEIDPFERDEYENKSVQVDPQKIIDYLRTVQKYPDEFKGLRQTSEESVNSHATSRNLVRLGSAFKRGELTNESLVIQAAYELGSKTMHPVCTKFEQNEKIKQHIKAAAKDPANAKVLVKGTSDKQIEEHLTDLERARAEVELWIKTISTAQFVKAREMALRAVGEGGNGIRQWWVSHKNCRYIRAGSPQITIEINE